MVAVLIGQRPDLGHALEVGAEIRVPGQVQPPLEDQILDVADLGAGRGRLLEDLVDALEIGDRQQSVPDADRAHRAGEAARGADLRAVLRGEDVEPVASVAQHDADRREKILHRVALPEQRGELVDQRGDLALAVDEAEIDLVQALDQRRALREDRLHEVDVAQHRIDAQAAVLVQTAQRRLRHQIQIGSDQVTVGVLEDAQQLLERAELAAHAGRQRRRRIKRGIDGAAEVLHVGLHAAAGFRGALGVLRLDAGGQILQAVLQPAGVLHQLAVVGEAEDHLLELVARLPLAAAPEVQIVQADRAEQREDQQQDAERDQDAAADLVLFLFSGVFRRCGGAFRRRAAVGRQLVFVLMHGRLP